MKNVVVVGASLAGLRTAEALRQAGFDGSLTMVGREPHPPYNRPPLTKAALSGGPDLASLALPAAVDVDARWVLGVSATGLDTSRRQVRLETGEQLPYDGVVIATGANARTLRAHITGPVVHHIRTFDDAVALHQALLPPDRHVLVIGGGLLGSEVASTATAGGHRVTLVEATAGPMLGALGPQLSAYCAEVHRDHGVDLRTSAAVLSLSPATCWGDSAIAVLADRTTGERRAIRADVVVAALGATPDTSWLRESGLDVDGGLRTDASLTVVDREGIPVRGVVAVGDVARVPQPLLGGAARRVEHWSTAVGHAGIAAATLLGLPAPRPAVLPSFWTDQHGLQIRGVGLPGAGDTTTVVDGSLEDGRFVATRTLRGRLVGAVAVNDTAGLLRQRPRLEAEVMHAIQPTLGGSR